MQASDPDAAVLFARVFGSADGQAVLAILRRQSIEAQAPADCRAEDLFRLEGKRDLCRLIQTLTNRGRDGRKDPEMTDHE